MRNYSWDYEAGVVTEWLRMGNCNYCGECCQVMIHLTVDDNRGTARDGEDGTNEQGLWCQWDAYGRSRFWQIRIAEDEKHGDCYKGCGKKCVDGSAEKGLICTAWPLHPNHVEAFDNCSYRFFKLGEWEIEEVERIKEV
jgi:hypothetical protein